MPLIPGMRLGPYEIVSPLGAGGMGEVYAARDTRLDRRVAIKILPPDLAEDREFQTRFQREARLISALTHPNICTLHDVGRDAAAPSSAAIDYLVLEFVEGEPLSERLRRGPLPPGQLLPVAAQLASALAAAHRAGIVHRDVKPGNVILGKGGPKLLDFGIAKPRVAESDSTLQTLAPTVPGPVTARGSFVGTPNYMAPEQIEGGEADPRSDIFALGAVIYEMATGRRAFEGKSQASVAASILADDPPSISSIQPLTPKALDRVVRKCLEKDPDARWQSAADLASELKWIEEASANAGERTAGAGSSRRALFSRWLPAIVALLFLIASIVSLAWRQSPPTPAAPVRAFIPAPPGISFAFLGDEAGPPAITRDGRRLVLAAYRGGRRLLFVRGANDTNLRPLDGTDDAMFPFWSPDGRNIGFFADGQLKRIDASGGPTTAVTRAADGRGGSWGNGFILFTPDVRSPIFRVNEDGTGLAAVTTLDQKEQTTHRWPLVLPDNEHFLYLAANHHATDQRRVDIYGASLGGGTAHRLLTTNGSAKYGGGYLLYPRGQQLLAQRFDARRLALEGEPVPLMDVTVDAYTWNTVAATSDDGLLAYVSGSTEQTELKWFDRTGRALGTLAQTSGAAGVALSPDGTRLALLQHVGSASDVWVYDLRSGQARRLTFDGTAAGTPVWNPAGDTLLVPSRGISGAGQHARVYAKRADGSGGEDEFFSENGASVEATDWSRDGRYVVFKRGDVPEQTIGALPLFGDRRPFSVLKVDYDHFNGRLSPDGRWMAYSSREAGTEEIFVTSFPAGVGKWQVSTGGGSQPLWRADGKEIFYLTPDSQLAAVTVSASGPGFDSAQPVILFRAPLGFRSWNFQAYAATLDGQRFILPASEDLLAAPLAIQTNWPSMVGR